MGITVTDDTPIRVNLNPSLIRALVRATADTWEGDDAVHALAQVLRYDVPGDRAAGLADEIADFAYDRTDKREA